MTPTQQRGSEARRAWRVAGLLAAGEALELAQRQGVQERYGRVGDFFYADARLRIRYLTAPHEVLIVEWDRAVVLRLFGPAELYVYQPFAGPWLDEIRRLNDERERWLPGCATNAEVTATEGAS